MEGEIGSFPSPDPLGTGYFHAYSPLLSWAGAVDPAANPGAPRLPFRTQLFNFDGDHQLEVEVRKDYDGSVNLYFADWKNPLRHLNVGFIHDTGILTNRRYWEGSFPSQIDAIFETCLVPGLVSATLTNNGFFSTGNKIFFARYVTADFNETSFLSEFGPVQFTVDDYNVGIQLDGNAPGTNSGRGVTLLLDNIDPNFVYVQIAYVSYESNSFATALVTTLFNIVPNSTTLEVILNGDEATLEDIDISSIINQKTDIDCPKTITQLENRLWGGNWRSSSVNVQALEQFALQVVGKPADVTRLLRMNDSNWDQLDPPYGYKDYQNTLKHVGYFRGEPYSFGMVFVTKGGKHTRSFPITGYDYWLDPTLTTPNQKGIVRFPSNMNAGYAFMQTIFTGFTDPMIMGVEFDMSAVVVSQWIQDNICGFYFTRTDRYPRLLYQGHVFNAYEPDQSDLLSLATSTIGGLDTSDFATSWMVSPYNFFPYSAKLDCAGNNGFTTRAQLRKPFHYGIYSNDHFFQRRLTDRLNTLVVQGQNSLLATSLSGGVNIDPDVLFQPLGFIPESVVPSVANNGPVQTYNVAENTYQGIGGATAFDGFVSAYAEGTGVNQQNGIPFQFYAQQTSFSCTREVGNRQMISRTHIGLVTNAPGANVQIDAALIATPPFSTVVNVYEGDPITENINLLYEPRLLQYGRISELIKLQDIATVAGKVYYKGDCFLQRMYNRSIRSGTWQQPNFAVGVLAYKHGTMTGLVQECAINTAMRFQETGSAYFPETSANDPGQVMFETYGLPESQGRDSGFDVVLSNKRYFGFDASLPFYGSLHPTMIRFSDIHLTSSFSDGYLRWKPDAFKEYDQRTGQINHLSVEGGRLLSIMERGINFHYVNERAVSESGSPDSFRTILGQGDTLSDTMQNLTDKYGTQHQWSVVSSMMGTYGVDSINRVIWKVTKEGFDPISITRAFGSITRSLFGPGSDHSDILHLFRDAPVFDEGIVGFYDKKLGNVGWSSNRRAADGLPRLLDTLIFNELTDSCLGTRGFSSPFYFLLNEDLCSVDPVGMPWAIPAPTPINSSFHIHGLGPRATFYGVSDLCRISISCNAGIPNEKIFDNFNILSNDIAPDRTLLVTAFQSATVDPFMGTASWNTPKYKEGAWHQTIPRADALANGATLTQDYQIGSYLRGRYLKMTHEWDSDQVGREILIAGIEINLRPSLV